MAASNVANAAVLYLRMSSSKQDKSIPAQRDELLAYAARQGYRVVRQYADEGISGDDTERRTGFLQLREDAEKLGDFGIILVWDADRLSRNDPLEVGYWLKPIRDAGIVVETPTGRVDWESLGGRLVYLISQEMKHSYLRDLSRNVVRGQLAAAKAGRGTGGKPPYGYRVEGGELVIDHEAAEIVRRIFREYLKPGASLRSVACDLNARRVPSPTGKVWNSSVIRNVIRNEKHTGAYVFGKTVGGKYFGIRDGEVSARAKNGKVEPSQPIIHRNRHEAIVDHATWEAAQKRMVKMQGATSPKRRSGRYVLTGLMRCGHCGYAMVGTPGKVNGGTVRMYCCSGYHLGGRTVCSFNSVAESSLLDCIIRLVRERYLNDDALDRIRKAIRKRLATEHRQPTGLENKQTLRRIADLDRQIERGAERVFSAPEGVVESLYAKLDDLRRQRDQLRTQLQAASKPSSGARETHEQTVEKALAEMRDLRRAFDKADPAALKELLSSLISKVELHFDRHQHGKYTRTTFCRGTIYIRPDGGLSKLFAPTVR